MAATITSRRLWMHRCATWSSRRATPTRRARSSARALGAEDRGEFRQRDTDCAGAHGRLKLREHETGGSPLWDELIEYSHELIGYTRADTTEARTSSYRRVPL